MVPGQEVNSNNLGIFVYFLHNNEAILMSTLNIQFHDKIRKFP